MGNRERLLVDPSNTEQSRAWDGDGGRFWAENRHHFDASAAHYHQALLEAARIGSESRVLDVGCGTGQSTRDAARAARSGRVVGVDLSGEMLEVARRVTDEEGLHNVEFVHADAQVHPFPTGFYDLAISRMGMMFFGRPVAAFANIGRALRPRGLLAFASWQPVSENEWFQEITQAMAAGRELAFPPPDAPGPFSLSAPDRVSRLLQDAGYENVELAGLRSPMYFGTTPDAAHSVVAGQTAWMLDGLDDQARRRALDGLHASLEAHRTSRGVEYASAVWLVTARRP